MSSERVGQPVPENDQRYAARDSVGGNGRGSPGRREPAPDSARHP